jgi:hypothetical protein
VAVAVLVPLEEMVGMILVGMAVMDQHLLFQALL